jgi:hypothetical protein
MGRHSRREVAYFFLSLLYVLSILLTWLACMMLAIAHHEHPAAVTWLASVKVHGLAPSGLGRLRAGSLVSTGPGAFIC